MADISELGRIALKLGVTRDRKEENLLRTQLGKAHIRSAAVDFGGRFPELISEILEHILVAAKRQQVISDTSLEREQALDVCYEALCQLHNRADGMNVGGKIAIVRSEGMLCAAVFIEIGLLYRSSVASGVAQRRIQAIL